MAKNINKDPFSEETKLKLEIFKDCFREWLPVFIYEPFCSRLYIYDFFAGSGYDAEGNPGSPIILLSEARGKDSTVCGHIRSKKNRKPKSISFIFNEKLTAKYHELKRNTDGFVEDCKQKNGCTDCVYKKYVTSLDFRESFKENEKIQKILSDADCAKFILLDQYGFTQVDEDVFLTLVNSPHTDFIFFISSSFLRRFREHSVTKKFLRDRELPFLEEAPEKCHQVVMRYFESLLPEGREYYLNHFTIKKGSNYYGLIFGTSHTLGMEKFQKVCWKLDSRAGESNCNLQNDFEEGSLFENLETNKIKDVKDFLEAEILATRIQNNIDGLKMALKKRCLPKVFTEVVIKLEKEERIERIGSKRNISTNIHRIKRDDDCFYEIKVLK